MNAEELLAMLGDDEFGLLELPAKVAPVTGDDRVLAGFQEIVEFARRAGRPPEPNPADIGEWQLAKRLKALNEDDTKRDLLKDHDELGLLAEPEPPASIEEAAADDPFGLLGGSSDLFELRHVPKTQTMPEEIARRRPAEDFQDFEPLFAQCHADLKAGRRKLLPFKNPLDIREGRFFVQNGVLLYVDKIGELTQNEIKKSNARTRCIFENGTESALLLQSLASNLYKDGKRVTIPDDETLAKMGLAPETPMASVYVLRSLSDDEQVRAFPQLHKIGSTSSTAKDRTARAAADTTFLGAPVEVVEEYRVPRGTEGKIERLLHRLFAPVRIDAWFEKENRTVAQANEWFAVPFAAIDEAISLIESETVVNYAYDPEARKLKLRP